MSLINRILQIGCQKIVEVRKNNRKFKTLANTIFLFLLYFYQFPYHEKIFPPPVGIDVRYSPDFDTGTP